jgi:DNA-binding transcriptional LysR family regulator
LDYLDPKFRSCLKGGMNLDQLEAIRTIAEVGSFRAAAEKLNRSQPALSALVRNLEGEFDIRIFDRSAYRPVLTAQGSAFLEAAIGALQAANYAKRVGIELGKNKAETVLHLSVDYLVSIDVIELIALECARPTPPVNLVLDKSMLGTSFAPLAAGEIDLAVAPAPNDDDRFQGVPLQTIQLVGAVSRRLLQELRKPTEAFLKANPQIIVYDKRHDETPDELLPKRGRTSDGHKIFVADHFTKVRLIEGGVGWGRLASHEVTSNKELVQVESSLFRPIELQLCLLRSKNRALGPIARAVWSVFEARAKRGARLGPEPKMPSADFV